jgi:hypothetical protein
MKIEIDSEVYEFLFDFVAQCRFAGEGGLEILRRDAAVLYRDMPEKRIAREETK